jgi:hypothetical protein
LEKYSRNKIKNGIFYNNKAGDNGVVNSSRGIYDIAGPTAAIALPAASNSPAAVVVNGGVPLGANKDIHRSYGGKQLSQADFESQILGVSSATEISVKSMICVKGRCFNADDVGGKS